MGRRGWQGLRDPWPSAAARHTPARPGGRCRPVRRRRRLEVRQAGACTAPRAGHPRPAQGPRPVRQLPPGDLLRTADPRLVAEARAGGGSGHPHHPRADRRHLLRPAAWPPHCGGRPLPRRGGGLRHDALRAPRDRAHSARRLPGRPLAVQAADERRQGQCAGDLPALEGRRHRGARPVPRCRARPHVRRQRGHAARQGAQEVRRRRDRQYVRRHPVRRGRDADRLDRHAAVGLAGRQQQGLVRAVPRQRTGYCWQRHRQSAGYNPVRCHDAQVLPPPTRRCRSHRAGRAVGAG
mmetsp:Transcript_6771/g.28512  ORF Transcript_6771/g.28512 Transcript_6771/m.28512 type:complete len:294 (-) Transcript_6771:2064-2945(-)